MKVNFEKLVEGEEIYNGEESWDTICWYDLNNSQRNELKLKCEEVEGPHKIWIDDQLLIETLVGGMGSIPIILNLAPITNKLVKTTEMFARITKLNTGQGALTKYLFCKKLYQIDETKGMSCLHFPNDLMMF